ncbi:MAG TPA: spore coat protein U domain-containing protein [Candidatus Deferrimicrobiaceae bacterium]
MKKVLMAVIAAALVAMAGSAMADTTTVAVSATVTGTCRFLSTGTISFALDPSSGGVANGTVGQPTFWCTRGTNFTITDDDGLWESGTTHRMRHATVTTEYIPYSFTYTSTGTGGGRGTTVTMDIASQVLNADFINALAGSYADTVTLTITP